MDRLVERLRSLTLQQRVIAGGGLLATFAVCALMLRLAMTEESALLYAGLSPQTAGEVIAALDAEGVDYTVNGSSILVAAGERDRLRLSLAQQNLPAPSAEGYELLDKLDGFSTTSDMFSVTYWRAKEGELARTLMTIPGVTAARVHIGTPQDSRFSRARSARTASVTLTAPAGITEAQVRAIQYLTALAVPNLDAEDVAVIDNARGLLTGEGDPVDEADDRRSSALEASLLSLLEARVGPGNARVNVSMSLARRREEIESRTVDPESAVVTSRNRTESRSTEEGSEAAVTVASDLPDGDVTRPGRSAEKQELSEDVSYAVSTTDRRVEILPGGIERLSVAVLINQLPGSDGIPVPRSPDELEALADLVRVSAGIDEKRGDTMTIRSLPFQQSAPLPGDEDGTILEGLNVGKLAELGIIGVTTILFGLLVLRPLMRVPSKDGPEAGSDAVPGMIEFEATSLVSAENPVEILRLRSGERPDEAAALLNAWLDDKENVA